MKFAVLDLIWKLLGEALIWDIASFNMSPIILLCYEMTANPVKISSLKVKNLEIQNSKMSFKKNQCCLIPKHQYEYNE